MKMMSRNINHFWSFGMKAKLSVLDSLEAHKAKARKTNGSIREIFLRFNMEVKEKREPRKRLSRKHLPNQMHLKNTLLKATRAHPKVFIMVSNLEKLFQIMEIMRRLQYLWHRIVIIKQAQQIVWWATFESSSPINLCIFLSFQNH